MRRLVAILLLLTLPFQALWGAAEPYCQHEHGRAAQHMGHHVHDHGTAHGGEADAAHTSDGTDAPAKAKAKALSMADHGHHCCSAWTLVPAMATMPRIHGASQPVLGTIAALGSTDPGRIERPNWPASL